MEMANINGKLDKCIKDNGRMDLNTDMEHGMEKMVSHILDNGNKANQMEKVSRFGQVKISMKDNF